MLTCKQISKALADGDYRDLPRIKRLALVLHVTLCFFCRRANKDIMTFQDISRAFRNREEDLSVGPKLSDEAKMRILEAMKPKI